MTTQKPLFSGSIVALVTPMDNHGNIDFETLEKLIEFHINAGTNSIVSVGTTGESATLSIEENVKVIEKTVELAKVVSQLSRHWRKCNKRSYRDDKIIT